MSIAFFRLKAQTGVAWWGRRRRLPIIIVMTRAEDGKNVAQELQSTYRSGVGKLLHMMRWSRPEVLSAVRELSKHMTSATLTHLKAMYRVMTYCVNTKNRGLADLLTTNLSSGAKQTHHMLHARIPRGALAGKQRYLKVHQG
jgi:hypothetical protein